MSLQLLNAIVAGTLLLHGIAHAIATVAALAQAVSGQHSSRPAVTTWLCSAINTRLAARFALPFWAASTVLFLFASAASWGIVAAPWSQLAVGGALVSTLGIAIFPATWPGSITRNRSLLNTSIAVTFNVVVLVSQLIFHWPGIERLGN